MNKDKNLLKEAIAEAKVLKQTAISNAKAALEESLTPHLKSMFENKLKEMDEEDEGEFDLMLEEEDEETEETETEETEEEKETETEEETEEEINIEDMSEEDLKNFVESVIQDMVEAGELEAATSETEEVSEPQDDEDLDFEIEDDETDLGMDDDDEEEVDIDALINEIKRHRKLKKSHKPRKLKESRKRMKRVPRKTSSNLVKENIELKRQLREFKKLNESLKEDFSGVNLLNAKLLYTNRIFKAQTLSESQKLDILDSFDKASSIKEVKLIYETLNKSLSKKSIKKRPIKEQLGFASKSTKSPTRLKEQKAPQQDTEMVARFKKLAGLE